MKTQVFKIFFSPTLIVTFCSDNAHSLQSFFLKMCVLKWQPTPAFLPGGSQGWGSLVGCCLWGHIELDTTDTTQQQQASFKISFICLLIAWFWEFSSVPSSCSLICFSSVFCLPFSPSVEIFKFKMQFLFLRCFLIILLYQVNVCVSKPIFC